jgi:hypothetical protein
MSRQGRTSHARRWAATLAAAAAALPAVAAPLDGLLTANPEHIAPRATLELGIDRLNRQLDFAKPDANDPTTLTTTAGDYRGAHLAGALRVADGLWLSGSLWQRRLSDDVDSYRYRSWQASGLYRFSEAAGAMPALAVRLSAWGNRASVTETTTPVRVPGAILNSVTVSKPSDRQLQVDLIGTWALSPSLDLSAQLGGGSTQLDYGALAATTRRNGCDYRLTFTGNDIFGELAKPCNVSGGVITQFFDSSGDYGVDVAKEIAWRGYFMQAGIGARWQRGDWTLSGGYLFHQVKRRDVDDILDKRGGPVHRNNHLFTAEAAYRLQSNLSVFGRAQVNSNLFFDDMPVTYNTSTSARFGSRFSLISLGLRADF